MSSKKNPVFTEFWRRILFLTDDRARSKGIAAGNQRIVMAYIVMAYIVMAYIVMAYIAMANIVMAYSHVLYRDGLYSDGLYSYDLCIVMA